MGERELLMLIRRALLMMADGIKKYVDTKFVISIQLEKEE